MGNFETTVDDEADEMVALGRMVSYACQRAQSMQLEFSTYCLEMALTSLIQDMVKAGVALPANDHSVSAFAGSDLH